jgi:hypothetical protein
MLKNVGEKRMLWRAKTRAQPDKLTVFGGAVCAEWPLLQSSCALSLSVPSLFGTRLGTVVAVNTPLALAVVLVVVPLSATFALANRRDQVCGFRKAVLSMAVWVVQAVTSPVAMATVLVLVGGSAPESLFIGVSAKTNWPHLDRLAFATVIGGAQCTE